MEITAEQLKDLVSTAVSAAVAESRKPLPLTETQLAQVRQDQDMRRSMGEMQIQIIANKRNEQATCSHFRVAPNRGCTGVHIPDGNYIICQQCQAKIRPGTAPANDDGSFIYNTDLFNHLFQSIVTPAMFG